MTAVWLVFVLGCGTPAPEAPVTPAVSIATEPTALAKPRSADVDMLAEALKNNAPLIDVRTVSEFESGHVPGAVNIPLDELDPLRDEFHDLPKDSPVYFICATGKRSETAATTFTAAGWQGTTVLGGTQAWVAAGKPVKTGPDLEAGD